ncbi:NAD(P)/FAD-dependent oxidoreductase [Thalassorhabdomicrobium marinisediminis]|uniref:FAD/NAD(P)-binding oxidoreductase n=1 Tax=Thalassorhabdomicrobium marinisediminis TaxID=2170577 RepID=A0A2T7FU81_9RHOB|nr:NAD(P)/FAD-dependent oxidoreductase [Thalassorhabdomicrobium marinisediminis]PVA05702.1 FAD/NAD(P)-binding oxidoreductase [Thalassorhabdomicrobium marinisediminis]
MTRDTFDIAIIGGGVVGCAIARRLTLDGARVVVIEKALDVLDGASKGNSAILHTGFDAPPGSLEQACIAAGYKEYLEIAGQMSLPILKSGALVLAWSDDQLKQLPKLIEKAHANGVTDVTSLSREEILRKEPNLSPDLLGGFAVPGEYLIDPWGTAHAYILQAIANGATLLRNAEVLTGHFEGTSWTLKTTQGDMHADHVINCAGLYGDIVDERLTGARRFTITPRKGQFVVFDKPASNLLSSIILPVPTKTTKGVVICRTIFGNLLVGPTAEDQESRTDGSTTRDALLDLQAKGVEMVPGLSNCDVTTAYAGLRPATEYQDYQIHQDRQSRYISVGGIRSTGLSSSLGIAQHVSALLDTFGTQFKPLSTPVTPTPEKLSEYHDRDWQCPGSDGIVCHCELVTKREIERVLDGPMPPATLAGLKRRTRVTMGRCQGFYCTGALAALTEGRLVRPMGTRDGS